MKENKKNTKSLIIYLIIFAFVVAVSINAIINQESKKQEIKMQISQYEDELEKLKSEKEELIEQKEKINTDKYIENVARNKLDMFLPNEKVYVHSSTRSPIEVSKEDDYPLNTRYEVKSIYDKNRQTYIYDLKNSDIFFLVSDGKDKIGENDILEAIRLAGNKDIYFIRWDNEQQL